MIQPEIGLIIWTTIIFSLLLIILKKYAWGPILKAVDNRNKSIQDSLQAAEKAKEDLDSLNADNEKILLEARKERDNLLKEARNVKEKIISEAKEEANNEAEKLILSAKNQIQNDKMKALTELKNQVAEISIQMATKIIKSELDNNEKQKQIIEESLKDIDVN